MSARVVRFQAWAQACDRAGFWTALQERAMGPCCKVPWQVWQ